MTAVQIRGAGRFAALATSARVQIRDRFSMAAGVSVVLVLMVTEVLGTDLFFVSAVGRHGRPAGLERKQDKQEDGEEAMHVKESSGYHVGPIANEATGCGVHRCGPDREAYFADVGWHFRNPIPTAAEREPDSSVMFTMAGAQCVPRMCRCSGVEGDCVATVSSSLRMPH